MRKISIVLAAALALSCWLAAPRLWAAAGPLDGEFQIRKARAGPANGLGCHLHAEDREPARRIPALEVLERRVLRRQSATRRDVDDQDGAAAQRVEI